MRIPCFIVHSHTRTIFPIFSPKHCDSCYKDWRFNFGFCVEDSSNYDHLQAKVGSPVLDMAPLYYRYFCIKCAPNKEAAEALNRRKERLFRSDTTGAKEEILELQEEIAKIKRGD